MKRVFLQAVATFALLAGPLGARPSPGAEAPPPAAPAVLIDTDFTKLAPGDLKPLAPHERIGGALPAGWQDNSSWAQVYVRYGRMEEEGRGYLRMEVAKLIDGRAQLMHLVGDFADDTYFRLTLTGRSVTGTAAEAGIRLQASPYTFLWRTDLPLRRGWQDFAFDFRLGRNPQPAGLWINLSGGGSVDIAKVRLVRMTREGLIAELKARHGDARPGNLLRISRLPLGLQSGWSIGRDNSDGDDVRITADPNVLGPSGALALAVRSPIERVRLLTAPFAVPLAFEKHTASLYARGSAKGRVSVVRGSGGARFELSGDEWKRIEVPFMPQLLQPWYALEIQATGQVWIDALQVERGEKATPYAGRLACEVALAVESPARVVFDDEPPVVRYAVTGKPPAGAVLKAKVVTPYDEAADLDDVKLSDQFLQKGELRFDRFPKRPYGPFRVEAHVASAAGEPLSPPNELVVYRLRRPRYWMKDAPNSHFGTHTNSTTRHILMAKAVGVNWTRLHDAGTEYIGWYHLEDQKGQWAFRDKELKRYRRYGMKVLGSFSTAPRWASYLRNEKPHNSYFDRFYQPVDLGDFANYVRTVTQRYKDGVIDTWDVWNEPWIHAWWGVGFDETKKDRDGYLTSKDAPADFARLMASAYKTAKEVDRSATVLGVNTTTGGGGDASYAGDEWTRGVVAASGLGNCDVVCYHHYTGEALGFPGDASERGYKKAVGPIIDKLGRCPKPVWMTEGSPAPQSLGEGFYSHTLPGSPPEDCFASADRLARYLVSTLAQGVEKIFLYSMHCHGYFGSNEWRVLVTPEGYLHPSAAAHSTTAWLLDGTKSVKQWQAAEGVTAYLFEGPGRAVAALSPLPAHADFPLPRAAGVDVLDLFGNPIPADAKLGTHMVYLAAPGRAADLEKLLRP